MNENQRISINYQKSLPGVHTKIYYWANGRLLNDSITFIGSANFSWNGFRDQRELLAQAYYTNIDDVFNVTDTISCIDPDVEDHINFYNVTIERQNDTLEIQAGIEVTHTKTANLQNLEYVDLPLLLQNDTAIQERAVLNWGQRGNQEPNQAYIPVSARVHQQDPDFFTPLEQPFTLITDDGQQLICTMAQQNRKAIQTSENNSIMGRYFKERLGVPFGARVDVQDVVDYGRTSVRIYKIDSETYFKDFGVDSPVIEV